MTREPLFKQLGALVIKWVRDEFFVAWTRLVSVYVITSGILLSTLSFVIYVAVKGNLITTIGNSIFNPFTQELVLMEALEALKERIITADILMMIIVIIVGVLLSYRTLLPIKKSMHKQKRFIADASHELRTPLAILKLDLELLSRNKEIISNELKNTVRSLHEEIDSIISLTNSLLLFAKENNGLKDKKDVEIVKFISLLAFNIKKTFQSKNITLIVVDNKEFTQRVDIIDIKRIFTNVIKNAFQYTPENGEIVIDISEKNKKLCCVIKDNGVGIKKENLKKIFEPFYQEESSRTHEGAGLGLSMVKKLIERHYGSIEITSEKNKGTAVTIIL